MQSTAYHVIPDNISGGWDVRREQDMGAHRHFDSRDEALEFGRRISLEEGVDLIVHDARDNMAWTISREKASVEMVIDEHDSLPEDIRSMLARDPNSRYIRRGPIQPKGKSSPRQR